jgi:hypothetical protein
MFFPIAGIAIVGAAIAASRSGARKGLGGFGAAPMGGHTAEALEALQRAASALYGPVDLPRAGPKDNLWDDPSYEPACPIYSADALEALYHAGIAEDAGEPEAYSAKVAAVQAWALMQTDCPGESADWAESQAERPVKPQ